MTRLITRSAITPAISPARPGDAPEIAAILSGWTDETAWLPRVHSRAEDREHADDLIRRGWVSVARDSGQVLGFMARAGEDIHALYVARPARGQGIGKALLDHAKARASRLGLWAFEANLRARAFYRREGFREVARGDGAGNDEGLPDIRLEWSRHA